MDDDATAYRVIGLAARMCLELGLHRRDALIKSFPNEAEWPDVLRAFWSVYSLDRRWSFGTGLPFVIQDEDIDPNLPEPVSPFSLRFEMRIAHVVIGLVPALFEVHDSLQSYQFEDLVFGPGF